MTDESGISILDLGKLFFVLFFCCLIVSVHYSDDFGSDSSTSNLTNSGNSTPTDNSFSASIEVVSAAHSTVQYLDLSHGLQGFSWDFILNHINLLQILTMY